MKFEQGRGVIARYTDFIPVNDKTPIISLGEGGTPLIYCLELSKRVGLGCDGDRKRCAARDRSLKESAFDTLASQAETMPFRISLSCFIIHS